MPTPVPDPKGLNVARRENKTAADKTAPARKPTLSSLLSVAIIQRSLCRLLSGGGAWEYHDVLGTTGVLEPVT